ncbi:MAG: carbohydrate ABC transporter permease [Devosia sp.]
MNTPNQREIGAPDSQWAYLLLLAPATILCAVFILYPVVMAVYGSFFSFTITNPDWRFVGWGNYTALFADPIFWRSTSNTVFIIIGSIILNVGLGTILAAILDRGMPRLGTAMRGIIFAPVVISSVAVGLIWLMIFDPAVGPLTSLFRMFNLPMPAAGWLGDPNVSMWMVLVVTAWQSTGLMMMLVYAGIKSVPEELYQSASLDGARGVRAFWYITLPSIWNIILVAALLSTIAGLKTFDLIYTMTGGGPANATHVLGTYIYRQAFTMRQMGIADAASVILLIAAIILGILQLRASRRT